MYILQLLKVVDEWSNDFDMNKQVDCIFRRQKGFDMVPHKRLLKKLKSEFEYVPCMGLSAFLTIFEATGESWYDSLSQ